MSGLRQQQIDAAQDFANCTIEEFSVDGGVHAETAIAATARMAGTFLFRSFGFDLEGIRPGQAVFSDAANQKGPELVQIVGGVLSQIGIALDESRFSQAPPPEHRPQFALRETRARLEPLYDEIRAQHGITLQEAAESAAVATAFLVRHCMAVLDADTGFSVAVSGIVEGAKTAPEHT